MRKAISGLNPGSRAAAFRPPAAVAQADGEPEAEPHCLVNDLRREPVTARHPKWYLQCLFDVHKSQSSMPLHARTVRPPEGQ